MNGELRALVIAADQAHGAALRTCLRTLGYDVSGVVAPAEAVEHADRARPEVAVIDLADDGSGLPSDGAGRHGSRLGVPTVYVVHAAGGPARDLASGTAPDDPFGCVVRPFAAGQLDATIRTTMSAHAREQALRAERIDLQQRLSIMTEILDSTGEGVVVADPTGKFLYGNPAAEQIVGVGATEGPQSEWSTTYGIYHPDRETRVAVEDQPLVRAIRSGKSVDEEDLFVRNPNRPQGLYIRVSARPLLDNAGEVRGGVATFRDVTERVRAEGAVAHAFAEGRLQVADTILHNVGNAINSVTTGIETVRRCLANDALGRRLNALADAVGRHRHDHAGYLRDDRQGRKVVARIKALTEAHARQERDLARTVERVHEHASRIVDLLRTQTVPTTAGVESTEINLHEALASAVRVLRDPLEKRGITDRVDTTPAPTHIHIREIPFHHMLVNLVKNAIEAIDELAEAQADAPAPSVVLRAYTDDTSLIIEVADNGIGIRARDRRVLFTPGYTTKKTGKGLGLHSAANFVAGCGGRIRPYSAGPGTGTTMRVTLPLSAVLPPVRDDAERSG